MPEETKTSRRTRTRYRTLAPPTGTESPEATTRASHPASRERTKRLTNETPAGEAEA